MTNRRFQSIFRTRGFVPEMCISEQGNPILPGFYRRSKEADICTISKREPSISHSSN